MSNQLKFVTSDKKIMCVDQDVMNCSTLVTQLLTLKADDKPLKLETIDCEIMTLIVNWATHHKDNSNPLAEAVIDAKANPKPFEQLVAEISEWDRNFMDLDQPTLLALMKAANFLQIDALLNTLCVHIANIMNNKTASELRDLFGIENDLDD